MELSKIPSYYDMGVYEPVKVLAAWGLRNNAYLWNVGKYLSRLGKKHKDPREDIKKMIHYLELELERLDE